MTCTCPKRFCYYRQDCRHKKPAYEGRNRNEFTRRAAAGERQARMAVKVLGGDWLYERR